MKMNFILCVHDATCFATTRLLRYDNYDFVRLQVAPFFGQFLLAGFFYENKNGDVMKFDDTSLTRMLKVG